MPLKHILIDLLVKNREVEEGVLGVVKEKCSLEHEFIVDSGNISLFKCGENVVYIYKVGSVIYLDILGEGEVFESLLERLPCEYVFIRLVERGFPE